MLNADEVTVHDRLAGSPHMIENAALLILSKCSLFRSGLSSGLAGWPFRLVETADSAEIAKRADGSWDVILLDIPSGAKAEEELRVVPSLRGVPFVVLADRFAFDTYIASLRSKSCGYLMKDISLAALQAALLLVLSGKKVFPTQLALAQIAEMRYAEDVAYSVSTMVRQSAMKFSKQEVRILNYLVEGDSNKMIARRLGNREETVKVQMKSLFRKLGLKNRTQAAVWAVTNGFGSERPDVVERAASPSGGATVVAYPPRANGTCAAGSWPG